MRAHALLFEVMDKEPSLVDVRLLFTCLGANGAGISSKSHLLHVILH
jgi:hypothetical protein